MRSLHRGVTRALVLAVVAVLVAASAYEAAVALGWLTLGPEPGQGPPAEGIVLFAALAAMLAGAVASSLGSGRDRTWAGARVLGPASAAFVLARFNSYDPYYAPSLRRFSEDGFVPDWWVFTLVGLAVVGALVAGARPGLGRLAGALVPLLSALTALAMGVGH